MAYLDHPVDHSSTRNLTDLMSTHMGVEICGVGLLFQKGFLTEIVL